VIGGVRGGLGGSSATGATPTDMAIGGGLVAAAVIGGGVFLMRRRAERRI
jgi:LPXTG-motif cell wall-anchored protein